MKENTWGWERSLFWGTSNPKARGTEEKSSYSTRKQLFKFSLRQVNELLGPQANRGNNIIQ